MHALRAGDDLLAADEDVKGAAVARVLWVRHCVEGACLVWQHKKCSGLSRGSAVLPLTVHPSEIQQW